MFNKCNNIHLRSQSFPLYFTTPHWVSNCKVLWIDRTTPTLVYRSSWKQQNLSLWTVTSRYFKVRSVSSGTRSVLQYCISNKWPSRPRTDRKWQVCAWEMHYTAPEYVQYLLLLTAILSGSINKCWLTQLSVRPTEFKRASYMDKCISGIDSVPPANKWLCCSFTLNLVVVPYINWACTLHWPPTQFITNR